MRAEIIEHTRAFRILKFCVHFKFSRTHTRHEQVSFDRLQAVITDVIDLATHTSGTGEILCSPQGQLKWLYSLLVGTVLGGKQLET